MKALLMAFCFGLLLPSMAWSACQGPMGGDEGQCAPDFTLTDLSGKSVKLSTFKNKVIFLNFWATWCEPCKIELPSMEKMLGKVRDDVVVLAVSIDSEGKKEIEKFFGKDLPPFPVLLDPERKVAQQYGTFKVPETYIIDKQGRVRDKIQGIREWDDSLVIHYLQVLAKL